MSLLNDMLRDLSHQQKTSEHLTSDSKIALDLNAQEQRELFNQSNVVKPLPRSVAPSLLMFVVVLASVLGWQRWSDKNVAQQIIEPMAAAKVTSELPVDNSTITAIETSQQSNPSTESPTDSSAVIDSTDPELVARLAALESAVTTLASVVADNNASTKAAVDEANSDIGEPTETVSVSVKDPFEVEENARDILPASTAFDERVEEPQTIENPVVQELSNEPAHLTIAPNPRWQDEEKARQARELATQGQVGFAIEQLQQFIASAEQPRESVKVLLDILGDQGDIQQINTVLAQAEFLSASEQAYYGAKVFVIQQDDQHAIQLLETHLVDAGSDENYRAFLAGLYQKNGKSLEAANHYRRLLSVFGDKPAYWLGFALAQDALNQPKVALHAYQRVNQFADLQPQVRSYIQQRVAALQQ